MRLKKNHSVLVEAYDTSYLPEKHHLKDIMITDTDEYPKQQDTLLMSPQEQFLAIDTDLDKIETLGEEYDERQDGYMNIRE